MSGIYPKAGEKVTLDDGRKGRFADNNFHKKGRLIILDNGKELYVKGGFRLKRFNETIAVNSQTKREWQRVIAKSSKTHALKPKVINPSHKPYKRAKEQ